MWAPSSGVVAMELILWRHADAEDGMPDAERKLTAKGIKQAKRMAKWLKLHMPAETAMLVSPTQRTLQTARELSVNFKIEPAAGTSGSPRSLLAAVGWPDLKTSVLVVGHQPTLGETAALLLTGKVLPWEMKKGAIFWLVRHESGGAPITQLRAAIYPALL
jgi:phosphohistidine phosphatase